MINPQIFGLGVLLWPGFIGIVLGALHDTRFQAVRNEELPLATRRAPAVGFVILAVWVLFVAVVRVLNVPLGGIRPEAFVLIAMMTALFMLGAVLLATLVVAASGRLERCAGSTCARAGSIAPWSTSATMAMSSWISHPGPQARGHQDVADKGHLCRHLRRRPHGLMAGCGPGPRPDDLSESISNSII